MLLTLIFAVTGIVLVAGGYFHPRAAETPMYRIGGYAFGAAFLLLALSFLLRT